MTYCLALKHPDGLVFAADTRSSAGVDYVTHVRKLHVFDPGPDRLFVILSAGNLATTQEVIHWLRRDLETGAAENLTTYRYLFEVANYVGRVSTAVHQQYSASLAASGVDGQTTLILGGQIQGQAHDVFHIYPQGNFISSSDDTPYLQIGENKYGKPMLDRLSAASGSLEDHARLALVSLDATVRSNVTVSPPFDLAIYRKDSFALPEERRLSATDPYLLELRRIWSEGLEDLFRKLPRFENERSTP